MKYISLAAIVFLLSLIIGFLVGRQQNQPQKEGLDSSETSQPGTTDVVLSFESIDLSQNPASLTMGEPTQFSALTQPANSEDNVYWYTFDSDIIHVSDSGLVTPLQAGTGTLVAQSELNTDFEVSMTITVLPAEDFVQIESISIDKSEFQYIMNHGDVSKIKVDIYPENATVTGLVFDTIYGDMLALTQDGTSVDVEAIGGAGYAYVTITSKSNPSLYETVKVWVFPDAHSNPSSLTYTAGDVITRANTDWGWYRMTLLTVHDVMPVNYSARYTSSLATALDNDKIIVSNAADYADIICAAGYEDACVGIDAYVQMLQFSDEANEEMYRLLAEFAEDDLEELWAITEDEGFTGGSYYYNNRWFHFGYLDYGLVLLISGQE